MLMILHNCGPIFFRTQENGVSNMNSRWLIGRQFTLHVVQVCAGRRGVAQCDVSFLHAQFGVHPADTLDIRR